METIHDYMLCPEKRALLNGLTRQTFGFDFESWVSSGFFQGDYIPYSRVEQGKMIANASANRMTFCRNGEILRLIQIGTVETAPEFRRQGHAGDLIREILADCCSVDGVYLFGNPDVAGFYDSLGFHRCLQRRYWTEELPRRAGTPFAPAGADRRDSYIAAVLTWRECSEFYQVNRAGLQLFYTAGLEQVYWCEDLRAFAVWEGQGEEITLQSILSREPVSMEDVLKHLPKEVRKVNFGFVPPETAGLQSESFDGGEDYILFCLGEKVEHMDRDGLYFPDLSHA